MGAGLSPELPVCAVSRISRSNQKLLSSTLGTVVQQLREGELALPVVFIIGQYAVPEGAITENEERTDQTSPVYLTDLEKSG